MQTNNEMLLIAHEIMEQYVNYRTKGTSRAEAIRIIRKQYSDELLDEDDRLAVMIGIGIALCSRKELTAEIAQATLRLIDKAVFNPDLDADKKQYYYDARKMLSEKSNQGNEVVYNRKAVYNPNWEVGDLFCHKMNYPQSVSLGIYGWSILFYKVGEYIDDKGRCHHLMHISLCPPGKEPSTQTQLAELGFLRVMQHDDKWDYLVQITIKSKSDEKKYGLIKLCNFKGITLPLDSTQENPLVAMPMHGCLNKGDMYPGFEDQICRLYKRFGKYLPMLNMTVSPNHTP